MLAIAWLVGVGVAGDIFVVTDAEALTRLDTRDFSVDLIGGFGTTLPLYVQTLGGSYDMIRNEFTTSSVSENLIFVTNIATGRSTQRPLSMFTQALAFDPTTQATIAFGYYNQTNAWDLSTGVIFFDPGVALSGADWFGGGGYIVGREGTTGDFYRIEAGMTTRLAPTPTTAFYNAGGLAYDNDTRLFWWLAMPETLLIEPQTWSVVGIIHTDLVDGAGGSIDTVLPQTPELLVTGMCPGTVYLTVVDATPGQHVQFASGTVPGTRTVRRGPCAGVQADLQNPVPRFDLIANDYGVASTTIQATAPMCGAGLVQAIDVATCLTTSVRTIPDGPLILPL